MVYGSSNFNLRVDSIQTRGGTEVLLQLPTISSIVGIFAVNDINNVSFIVSVLDTGEIYAQTTEICESLGTIENCTFLEWNQNLIINVNSHIPQVWDKVSNLTYDYPIAYLAPDWILDSIYPVVMTKYGKGNSLRAWAIGRDKRKNVLYFSASNDGLQDVPDFNGTGSGFLYISLRSDESLVGMIPFGDQLILFSETQAFIIDDSPIDIADWGYAEAQWKGGALNNQSIVAVENDIFVLAPDGTIYSITAVMEYGDYKIASITNPASIDIFLQSQINIKNDTNINAIFDPSLRAVKFFVPSIFSSQNDTALVYFIDKLPQTGWSIHNNTLYPSGYNALCSTLLRTENNTLVVITGSNNGKVWILETETLDDNNNYFPITIKTPFISGGEVRTTKRWKNGFIELISRYISDISLSVRIKSRSGSYGTAKVSYYLEGARFDKSKWNNSKFASENVRQVLRYQLNTIGTAIQQIFDFSSYYLYEGARFDKAKWDKSKFAKERKKLYKFNITNNILDVVPIAQRLKI